MPYLPEKFVLDHIKSRDVKHGEEKYTIFEAYLGTEPYSKKPKRIAAKSQAKLEKAVRDFYKRLGSGGDTAVLLTAYQSVDARNALDLLAKANLSISLSECARRVIENAENMAPCTTTLEQAYKFYLAAQEGKSDLHKKDVRCRVGKFVETFGAKRLLSEVTPKETNANLEGRLYDAANPKTKTTFNNHLGYVKTFMLWCAEPEQGFIKKSPIAGMKLKTKEYVDPEFMKAADVEKLFRTLEKHKNDAPQDLADAILSFFCGVRQCEIARVRDGERSVRISLEHQNIRIIKCKGSSKGVKPRSFTIPPTALAWMKSFDFMAAAQISNKKFRDHLNAYAKEAGIALPENAGRHTFITMHAAAYHDQGLLTSIAGNSPDVRREHYDGLTFEDEGKAYFAIMPKAS